MDFGRKGHSKEALVSAPISQRKRSSLAKVIQVSMDFESTILVPVDLDVQEVIRRDLQNLSDRLRWGRLAENRGVGTTWDILVDGNQLTAANNGIYVDGSNALVSARDDKASAL